MKKKDKILNQRGAVPILVLLAVIGLLIYLAVSSSASFKDKLFGLLYPKPASHASVSGPIGVGSTGSTGVGTSAPSGGTGSGYQRVFVTSTRYNGNLGGVAGADDKCQQAANNSTQYPDLKNSSWKAWLSDSTTSAASRLTPSGTPYKLLNGTTIANNLADLTDGYIEASIRVTEQSTIVTGGNVWTNTTTRGLVDSPNTNENCNNWTSADGLIKGKMGNTTIRNSEATWTSGGIGGCGNVAHLYCFEQIPVVKTPPCGSYGDLNQDGKVTAEDANIALKIFTGSIRVEDTRNADVNGDGSVTSEDARLIQRYVEGLESTFPVCTTTPTDQKPIVNTTPATNIGYTAAMLSGSVNPNGVNTIGWFRFSSTNPGSCNNTFGDKTPFGTTNNLLGAATSFVTYAAATSINLSSATTYYFCAIASNSAGMTFGNIQQFTTSGSTPTPITTTACTPCSADINGDKRVTITDYSGLLICFNKRSTDKDFRGNSCNTKDINKDGSVNNIDRNCLRSQFGKRCTK